MAANLQIHPIRDSRAMRGTEYFFISAIVTILGVRLFLELTGFPRLGGGSSIHVAHVLWGGLLMAAAILVLILFLNRGAEELAALAGGAGFGLFIDEVGKFVTRDNNYFFQPAVAIMYVTFVAIFLAARYILTAWNFTRIEVLSNAINEMRDIPAGSFREDTRERVLAALDQASQDWLTASLLEIIDRAGAVPEARPAAAYERWKGYWHRRYRTLASRRWFNNVIVAFFVIQAASAATTMLALMFGGGSIAAKIDVLSFAEWAILGSNLIASIFVFWGLILIRRSRLAAFRMFERSMLISIFISQFFLFISEGFDALPGFIFDLLLLLAIRFFIQHEEGTAAEFQISRKA